MRGEAHLRPVGLVPSFLEHLGRSSIVEGLVRSLVVVEAQVGPNPWLKGQDLRVCPALGEHTGSPLPQN